MKKQQTSGVSTIEIILFAAAFAILVGVIAVSLRPSERQSNQRDSIRRGDTTALLNAVWQYSIDNSAWPGQIDSNPNTAQVIGTTESACDTTCSATPTEAACADISDAITPQYLDKIPLDPRTGTPSNTDYYINITAEGALIVGACEMEDGSAHSVERS